MVARARRLLERALQVAVEGLAVEQAGQLVVGRLVGELEGHQALVRDVLEDQHGADGRAARDSGWARRCSRSRSAGRRAAQGDALGEAEARPLLQAVAQQLLDVGRLAALVR